MRLFGVRGVIGAVAVVGLVVGYLATRSTLTAAPPPAPPRPAIPVLAGTAETRDMPVFVRGLGTVQAYNTATVKTRVDGHITKVLFREGQEVKEGDPLFEIDPRPFQAALDQAEAAKQRDEGQLRGAKLDLERYGKLLGPGFQTRQSYDDQQATVDQLTGSIKADQAAIETAKLNLGYASIHAPFDGRTGARLVDLGNFVQASQGTPLVSITQLKPIFVSFTVPQDVLDEIRQNQVIAALDVIAYASDDQTKLADGKLTLIDNQIDAATGTIHLKARFENQDERLWPGEFVNARLVLAQRKSAVTVPAQTVMQGPQGNYVYVIKPDDTVDHRKVKVLSVQDEVAVIGDGLTGGERVVVEGQYRLTDGAKIRLESPQQSQQQTTGSG
jgi:multidrug efflux system membrane fusion protein